MVECGAKSGLIFPAIIKYKTQIVQLPKRRELVKKICRGVELSGASKLWIVDGSLEEDTGADSLSAIRFPSLISLHEDLARSYLTLKFLAGHIGVLIFCFGRVI